jgi:hypothetical protein
MTAYSPEGQALRAVLSGLIATAPDMSRELAERLSGLSVAYATGNASRTYACRTAEPSSSGCAPESTSRPKQVSYDRRTPHVTINPLSPGRLPPPPDHSVCDSIRFIQSVGVRSRD